MVSMNTSQESAPSTSTEQTQTQDGASSPLKANDKPLDIVFLQDTTGSQGPYIQAARKAVRSICDKISASGDLAKNLIRFGLIAFRDHPPQDNTYVTKPFGFTSDINVMQRNLASLIATGGGDGPEAQTAALAEALNLEWTADAVKMVILITDAPPHGIGERGDGFDKSPDQNDPLDVARQMAERGITLFVIACEPSLSQYKNAVDFYEGLVQITSGKMFPLLMAEKLGDYIVGSAVETIETEKLIGEFEHIIVDDVFEKDKPFEFVTANLQQQMQSRGVEINTVEVENIYNVSDQSKKNVSVWSNSPSIGVARNEVGVVTEPRVQAKFGGGVTGFVAGGGSAFGGLAPGAPLVPVPSSFGSAFGGSSLFGMATGASLVPPAPSTFGSAFGGSSVFGEFAPSSVAPRFAFGASAPPVSPSATGFMFGPSPFGDEKSAPPKYGMFGSAPPPVAPAIQEYKLAPQQVSQQQAQRIVQQSMSRNAKVTSEGMISKTGKIVPSEVYSPRPFFPKPPEDSEL